MHNAHDNGLEHDSEEMKKAVAEKKETQEAGEKQDKQQTSRWKF